MSLPSNLQQFDRHTAKIFAMLYESFPIPLPIQIADLDEDAGWFPENDDWNDSGKLVVHTIQWLQDAGYISIQAFSSQVQFKGCVLTAKGLEVLKAFPPSLSPDSAGKTLGDFVTDAVKSGAQESISDAVKGILGKGAEMLVPIVNVITQSASAM